MHRRFLTGSPGNRPAADGKLLFTCQQVEVTRYRWRGHSIPTPWTDPYTKLHGPAKWTYCHLYVILDICSRYAAGWMLADLGITQSHSARTYAP